jgi:hypothetical protein
MSSIRENLGQVIEAKITKAGKTIIGKTASVPYQYYADQEHWIWAVDVDIGQEEILIAVPLASMNDQLFYADVGKPVELRQVGKGKYEVVGIAKTAVGTKHIMYVSFTETLGQVVSEETIGYYVRLLTYDELDTYGGYGVVPYGARGRFNAQDELVALLV